MIYQILAGLVVFAAILLIVRKSKDDKILNLMSLIWLQGFTLGLILAIAGRLIIGSFVFVISVGLVIKFWSSLSVKVMDEYYDDKFFGSALSILTFLTVIASFILFLFIIYLDSHNFFVL